MKKLTVEEASELFKINGYELLEDEYIGNHVKMRYRCPIHRDKSLFMRVSDLKNGVKCPHCRGVAKLEYEDVKKEFGKHGYTLITKEYKNNKQKLTYICSEHPNEEQTIKFNSLKNGSGCKLCAIEENSNRIRLPFEKVFKAFEDRGYTLLETEYINNRTKMEYICSNHPGIVNEITYSSLQQGHGCSSCAGTRKMTLGEIRDLFKLNGFTLLENEILKNSKPLKCVCDAHPDVIQYKRVNTIKKGHGCPVCYGNDKLTIEYVRSRFEEVGLTLIEDSYINNSTKMRYICNDHREHIQEVSYGEISKGSKSCNFCANERRSGENAWNYNPNKTENERMRNREYPEYLIWRKSVYLRDNYTCQCCGISNTKGLGRTVQLNAHHLNNYVDFPDQATDIKNGVTLCKECHSDFHAAYGIKNNDIDQFHEYIQGISWNWSIT